MNRRDALRLLATGAALHLAPANLLAALREARSQLEASPAPRTLNPSQYATVKTMAELIIPKTDTPGATDVGASDFIDLILTEWCDEPDRDRFLAGLADVDTRAKALFGKDFVDCSGDQQADILSVLGERMTEEIGRNPEPEHRRRAAPKTGESFYPMLRRLTLTAYYTSEAGATDELHFEIIPDHHDACAPITAIQGDKENQ